MAEWNLNDNTLSHHGILGMKWGVRRYQNKDGSLTAAGMKRYGYGPNGEIVKKGAIDKAFDRKAEKLSRKTGSGDTMKALDSDSSVTKRVKNDYNNLSEAEFFKKYSVTKERYRKRVNKYGDPYTNSPLAKLGKKLAEKNRNNREVLESIKNIEKEIDQKLMEIGKFHLNDPNVTAADKNEIMETLSEIKGYHLVYDVTTGTYDMRKD